MIKTLSALTAAMALLLAFASVGFAQSSVSGYNDVGGDVQNQVVSPDDEDGDVGGTTQSGSPGDDGGIEPASTESLPFTGLDLAMLAGAGMLLLALGLVMRRLTRAPDPA